MVIDTATDTEIATGMNDAGLNGIALTTINAATLQYIEERNEILVNGRGNVFVEFNMQPGDPYTGGIETIDVDTYTLDMLMDDGTAEANEGFFFGSIVATETRGYVITSSSYCLLYTSPSPRD